MPRSRSQSITFGVVNVARFHRSLKSSDNAEEKDAVAGPASVKRANAGSFPSKPSPQPALLQHVPRSTPILDSDTSSITTAKARQRSYSTVGPVPNTASPAVVLPVIAPLRIPEKKRSGVSTASSAGQLSPLLVKRRGPAKASKLKFIPGEDDSFQTTFCDSPPSSKVSAGYVGIETTDASSHASGWPAPRSTPRSNLAGAAENVTLKIDFGKILDAYDSVRRVLELGELYKATRLLKGFLNAIQDCIKEINTSRTALRTLEFQQAEASLKFHRDAVASILDTLQKDSFDDERTDIALDLLDCTWTSLRQFLEMAYREVSSSDSVRHHDSTATVDELITIELEEVSEWLRNTGSSTFKSMRAKVSAGLRAFAGTSDKPPAKLRKRRPLDHSAFGSADAATSSGRGSMDSERTTSDVTSDVLNGEAFGTLKLSLRTSLIIFSSAPSSFALEFPRPEAEMNDVVHSSKGTVVAATLIQWIRILTDTIEVGESDYADTLDTFFMFFRHFTTPDMLFQLLISRYIEEEPDGLNEDQLRGWRRYHRHAKLLIVKMIVWWTRWYWLGTQDDHLLKAFMEFAYDRVRTDPHFHKKLAAMLALNICLSSGSLVPGSSLRHTERLQEDADVDIPICAYAPTAFKERIEQIQDAVHGPGSLTFEHINIYMFCEDGGAEELARALTLMESELFHNLLPEDIAAFMDTGTSASELAPKLRQWTLFTNSVSLWPVDSILRHSDTRRQADIYLLFIDIASRCRDIRNFNTAHAIVMGLDLSPLRRLRTMHTALPESHQELLGKLKTFFDPSSNYGAYREELKRSGPAVPLIHVLRRDIIHTYEAYKIELQNAEETRRTKEREMINKALEQTGETVSPSQLSRMELLARTQELKPREGPGTTVNDFDCKRKEKPLVKIAYYRNLRQLVRNVERCYGDYKIPKEDIVHEWIEYYRKPLELAGQEFETRKEKYYQDSLKHEPKESQLRPVGYRAQTT